MNKIFKYGMVFISGALSFYFCLMTYFISTSNLKELVSFANEPMISAYGGPTAIVNGYLKYIEIGLKENSALKDSDYINYLSYLTHEPSNNGDRDHYNKIMNFMGYLLAHGASMNYSKVNDNGQTVLHSQVIFNNIETIKFLLEKGANPKLKVKKKGRFYGYDALDIVEYHQSQVGGYEEMITLLEKYY